MMLLFQVLTFLEGSDPILVHIRKGATKGYDVDVPGLGRVLKDLNVEDATRVQDGLQDALIFARFLLTLRPHFSL